MKNTNPPDGVRGRVFLTGLTCVFAAAELALALADPVRGREHEIRLIIVGLTLVVAIAAWLKQWRTR